MSDVSVPVAGTSGASLSHIPLFAHLDAAGDQALLRRLTRSIVKENEPVFWFGDSGDTLYIIDTGRVAVTAPDADGNHVLLDTIGPGGIFGELSLLDGGPRSATVRAVSECSLLALNRESFHAFLLERPDAAIDILQVLGARQRTSTATIRGLRNPNAAIAEATTRWQRVSDVVASVAASHVFTLAHLCWFGGWITLNILAGAGWLPAALAFDPFPFGLLTLIVSLEAIFLSIFVLVSQNRQSERDRIRTDLDYQVNVKAHVEIMHIAQRLERIERAVVPSSTRSAQG